MVFGAITNVTYTAQSDTPRDTYESLSFGGTGSKIKVYDHSQKLYPQDSSDPATGYHHELLFANGRLRSTCASSAYYIDYGDTNFHGRDGDPMPDYSDASPSSAFRYATFRYDLSQFDYTGTFSDGVGAAFDIVLLDTNLDLEGGDYVSSATKVFKDYVQLHGKLIDPGTHNSNNVPYTNAERLTAFANQYNYNTSWFDCNKVRGDAPTLVDYSNPDTTPPLGARSATPAFQSVFTADGLRTHARLRVEVPTFKFKGKILLLRLGLKARSADASEVSVGTVLVQPLKETGGAQQSLDS